MPTYTFHCKNCKTYDHIVLPVAERNDPFACFWCEQRMERVPDAPAIQFKGSGFYVTDYKRKTP